MSISWKTRNVYYWPLLILVTQLIISVGSFYSHYKFQTLATARAAENEIVEMRLHDINCDRINTTNVLAVMKGSVSDAKSFAELFFIFGMLSGLTAIFALLSLVALRQKHAAISQV